MDVTLTLSYVILAYTVSDNQPLKRAGNHNVTCRPTARERLGKQARNKYSTNNRVNPFLGNARNAHTQQ
jgi:hypothetical protein